VVSDLICAVSSRVTWATNSPEALSVPNPAVASLFLCTVRSCRGERKAQGDHTARPFDPDSQLQNNLSRWYDARVGRWLSEDPVGFAAGDGNLYRYAVNSPLAGIDATGLARQPRHHWFMAYHNGPDDYGQGLVDAKCRIPHININRYTTEYSREEHAFIHRKVGGEIIVGDLYRVMYERLLEATSSCCTFLVGMKALMLAWHEPSVSLKCEKCFRDRLSRSI